MSSPRNIQHLVYLETTVLLDLVDETEYRHRWAWMLFERFRKYSRSNQLRPITSLWAFTEAEGRYYEKLLQREGVPGPTRGTKSQSPRNIIPPNPEKQREVREKFDQLARDLSSIRTEVWPLGTDSASQDPVEVWRLSRRLVSEVAIWPQDSMHLAITLYSGCSMIISDDEDLLDKIEHCRSTIIEPYLQQQFSNVAPPPFSAYGLGRRSSILPHISDKRPYALKALAALGFR